MKFKSLAIIATLTTALTGCGGEGDLAASGDVSGFMSAGSAVQTGIQQAMASLMGNPAAFTPPGGAPSFAGPFDGCLNYTVGSSTSDNHWRIEYNCNKVNNGGTITDWKGFQEYEITDPNGNESKGYRMDMELTQTIWTGNDPGYTMFNGFFDLKSTSTKLTYESDFTYGVDMPKYRVPLKWTWRRASKSVYTPTNMAQPFNAGTITMEGHVQVKGLVGDDANGKNLGDVNITFEVTSKGLKYDNSCGNYYSEGSIIITDGAGNELTFKFENDCTTKTASFNGTPIVGWMW